MKPMLEITNLSFSYSEETEVLKNLDFTLNEKEILCIKGPNGAGKTTFLKILCGLIRINSCNLKYMGQKNKLRNIKDDIAYVPSDPYLYTKLTGMENLELICDIWKEDKKKFMLTSMELANFFNLEEDLNTYVEDYSLGMKHKLYLIGMLSRNTKIIIMDEPLTALDIQSQNIAIKMFHEYVQLNKSIIFVSHINDLITRLATKELNLVNGRFYD
ncbi:ABC transporter ATP-binding protein [Clostridium beijerinckii]|nr:ABC transporter ATP-binding protein [Clostridium beijerinckii]NRZ29503.1 ABC-2 type transport system ATP-binding protein [Clostridium beijerinckii]NYC00005.1 ABC-2 type transport system ATP-binding protein [Clostridium beijerinckii]OOM22380.1 putative ABC transporter ATP-binding protein YxlF [Clostridium beijerinckii]QUN37926.1 ABC transporter ATP-binding protein [Clostridium beijerinckii]SQB12026.1 ABC transporter ATP-binding protein [Clostridium beijerinckii]